MVGSGQDSATSWMMDDRLGLIDGPAGRSEC